MKHTIAIMLFAVLASVAIPAVHAETRIRIMPPSGGVFAAGQRFDVRIEATSDTETPPRGLKVLVNGEDITARNVLDGGAGGEAGAGGTGATAPRLPPHHRAARAAAKTTNFLAREFSFDTPGRVTIAANTLDGATARVELTVEPWAGPAASVPARNIILLLGDGMGAAHRTAARIVSRGVRDGKAVGRLAMDTLDVTGMVMTASLNSVITDSSPGMAAYVTGQKSNNNQEGVFPDNTPDAFDNPRVEYLGELLRRTRGAGFNVGIVTTSDLTDSTPAANAVHTSDRHAGAGIAARFLEERNRTGVTVLLGGGLKHFVPEAAGGTRTDGRQLRDEFAKAGFWQVSTASDVETTLAAPEPPKQLLGLFRSSHLPVAFDKVGAGRYSEELHTPANASSRDVPMLDDLARLALRSLAAHSPAGFYLMIEAASIDKRAHAVDAERTIWDVIELDRAVEVALEFARRTNTDADPSNDTLVIVTADHECGGLALIGVGNERYAPVTLGRAVRDYAAVFRFEADQELNLFPNYVVDDQGYPTNPDPSRKLLLGWAAGPDHYENWISNRRQHEAAAIPRDRPNLSVANPRRDGPGGNSDNKTVNGQAIPGFIVRGTIENGETACPADDKCPADTGSVGHTVAGHTASDVPLSAAGPGAWQFTGVYENTDVFLKILRSASGTYRQP